MNVAYDNDGVGVKFRFQLVEVAQRMFIGMIGIDKSEIYGLLIMEENGESFGNITKNQPGIFICLDVFLGDLYEFPCPFKCIEIPSRNLGQITGVDTHAGTEFDHGLSRGQGAEILIEQAVFFGRTAIARDVCYLSVLGVELQGASSQVIDGNHALVTKEILAEFFDLRKLMARLLSMIL